MFSEAKKQALLALFTSIEELKAMLDMVEGKSGLVTDGGEGSGNFNHKGRPGEVGGSSTNGGAVGSSKSGSLPKPKSLANNLEQYKAGGLSPTEALEPEEIAYIKQSMKPYKGEMYRLEEGKFTANSAFTEKLKPGSTFKFDGDIRSFSRSDELLKRSMNPEEFEYLPMQNPVVFITTGEVRQFDLEPYSEVFNEYGQSQLESFVGGRFEVVSVGEKDVGGGRNVTAYYIKQIEERPSDNAPAKKLEDTDAWKTVRDSAMLQDGGEGSGNFGHSGRPGKVGGSSKSGSGGGYLANPDRKRTSVNPNPYSEEGIDDADDSDETAGEIERYRSKRVNRLIGAGDSESTHIALSIADYCNLNSYEIRHKSTPEYEKKNELIERYLAEAPLWDGQIYKGKSMKPEKVLEILERGEMSMPMIESWTEEPRVAMVFAVKGKGERVLFEVEKPKSAVPVAYYSDSYREKEILMPSDRKYKVRDSYYDGVFYYISLEEVNAPAQRKKASDSGAFSMSVDGGEGSGNHGHAGRPGKVGGSGKGVGARERTKENKDFNNKDFGGLKSHVYRNKKIAKVLGDERKAEWVSGTFSSYFEEGSYDIRHDDSDWGHEKRKDLYEYLDKLPVYDGQITKQKMLTTEGFEKIKEGEELVMPYLESWTSKGVEWAEGFSNGTGYYYGKYENVVFILDKTNHGAPVADMSVLGEGEVMMPEGMHFRVTKIDKGVKQDVLRRTSHVYLEEVRRESTKEIEKKRRAKQRAENKIRNQQEKEYYKAWNKRISELEKKWGSQYSPEELETMEAEEKALNGADSMPLELDGGEGSGNFGHAGRVGKVGGSAPGEGASATKSKPRAKTTINLGMDENKFYSMSRSDRDKMSKERVMSDIGCDEEKANKILKAASSYGWAFSYNIRHREEGIYNEYADTLSEYLEKAPVLDKIIFKGKSLLPDRYKKIIDAGEFEFPMIESWSESSSIAGAFTDYGDNKKRIPVIFKLVNNQSAVGTALITSPREKEVLSPEGAKYRIVKVSPVAGIMWINVEEM